MEEILVLEEAEAALAEAVDSVAEEGERDKRILYITPVQCFVCISYILLRSMIS